jgi:hypothetical protein
MSAAHADRDYHKRLAAIARADGVPHVCEFVPNEADGLTCKDCGKYLHSEAVRQVLLHIGTEAIEQELRRREPRAPKNSGGR